MSLLANLNVNSALEGLDFFFLDKELLSLLEASNLLLDDLNFFFFFLDFLFLGVDDDFSDNDLLFDLFLFNGSLLQSLSGIGQLSSSSGLFSDNFLSLSSESLNILLDGSDISGNLINLFLNLRFLSDSNNLKGCLELFSLSDKSVGLNNFLINLFSNLRDLLSCLLNGGLQISSLSGKCFNLSGDSCFSFFEVSLLLLNNSGELFLSFLGNGVNLFTSLFTLFFLLLDLSDDGLFGLLNLLDKVSDLLLTGSNLILDNSLLIFLSLNLLLNDTDLLFSFLGDSGSLRFNELGLIDLRNFFLVNGLGLSLRNDALSLFLKNFLFLSLLLFNGRLLNGNLSNEL
jgi:hypothetical protein